MSTITAVERRVIDSTIASTLGVYACCHLNLMVSRCVVADCHLNLIMSSHVTTTLLAMKLIVSRHAIATLLAQKTRACLELAAVVVAK